MSKQDPPTPPPLSRRHRPFPSHLQPPSAAAPLLPGSGLGLGEAPLRGPCTLLPTRLLAPSLGSVSIHSDPCWAAPLGQEDTASFSGKDELTGQEGTREAGPLLSKAGPIGGTQKRTKEGITGCFLEINPSSILNECRPLQG